MKKKSITITKQTKLEIYLEGKFPFEMRKLTPGKNKSQPKKKTRPSRPIGATRGSLNECVTDQPTNQPTDRPTDTASYRGALSHLKKGNQEMRHQNLKELKIERIEKRKKR